MQRLWAGGELKEAHGKAEANMAGQESAGRQQTCAGGSREWEDYQAWQVHGRAFGFSPKGARSKYWEVWGERKRDRTTGRGLVWLQQGEELRRGSRG